mmetsp:Transcript_19715/g.32702  ORF Transcript_19715/g.32702 Transcript_19715/m.32702 type:complete len:230 (-) Transcript_19715:314-1003(-)
MFLRFHGIQSRPEQSVVHQCRGGWTGKSHVHTGINHGFHEHENVGRSAARDTCGNVNKVFVIDVDLFSKRTKDLRNLIPFVRFNVVCAAPYGHTLSNLGWRIGHGPCDLGKATVRKDVHGLARNDTQQRRIGGWTHTAKELGAQVLWFDGTDDHISILHELLHILGQHEVRMLLLDGLHAGDTHIVNHNLRSGLETCGNHGVNQCLCHLAASNEGNLAKDTASIRGSIR